MQNGGAYNGSDGPPGFWLNGGRGYLFEPAGKVVWHHFGVGGKGASASSGRHVTSESRPTSDGPSVLSARERQIVALVAEGATDRQIGERLFISLRTVGSHLDRIRDKTGCRRRGELTRLAIELELRAQAASPADSEDATPSQHMVRVGSSNLPRLVSSFVGRNVEVSEVCDLVGQSRLVSLVGTGGAGKTRLALRVADELLDGSAGGVWLVELAPLADPEMVPLAVASVLGIKDQPRRSSLETVVDALSDQHLLIVVDNCEHVIEAAAKLAEAVLRSCPRVRLLATSREPLGIASEHVYRVPPMSLPPMEVEGVSDLGTSEAVALLTERAHAQQSGFALNDDNAALVASVCRRLDGLPLAVELAAARLRSMTLADLHDRLDRRFGLLSAGRRTTLPRHQTLDALIDWSYDLLNDFEKTLLRRLSVFAGDFDIDAAEAVCALSDLEPFNIAELLASLVNKSLVTADTSGHAARYRMLEIIRGYAADLLIASGPDEAERLHQSRADYYRDLVERAAPQLRGPFQAMWMTRLEDAYPNLRAVADWLLSSPQGAQQVLQLFGSSRAFWWAVSTHDAEVGDQLDRAFSLAPVDTPMTTRAAAMLCKAYILYSSDLAAQGAWARQALELARAANDTALQAEALGLVAYNTGFRGTPEQGITAGHEAVNMARQLGDPVILAGTLLCYAGPLKSIDRDAAEAVYREGLNMVNRSCDLATATLMHGDFGDFLLLSGRVDEAREHLEAALAMVNIPGSRLADVALGNLGLVHLDQGDPASGMSNFTELLRRACRSGDLTMAGFSTLGLACCTAAVGDPRRAATLLGGANRLYRMVGEEWQVTDRKYHDRFVAILRASLGENFDSCYESGRGMSRSEIIDFALHT